MVVRFFCVIRVLVCARVSRVCVPVLASRLPPVSFYRYPVPVFYRYRYRYRDGTVRNWLHL